MSETIDPLGAGEVRDLGEFAFEEGASIRGKVVDLGGRAVAGAALNAMPTNNRMRRSGGRWGAQNSAVTDESGEFVITGLTDGTYQVTCVAEGYLNPDAQPVSITEGTSDRLGFTVSPGTSFEGVVVNADGTPASGVNLYLYSTSGGGGSQAMTDSEGRFTFSSAPKGDVSLNLNMWANGVNTRTYNKSYTASSVTGLPKEIVIPAGAIMAVTVTMAGDRDQPSQVSYTLTPVDTQGGQRFFGMNQNQTINLDKEGQGEVSGLQEGEFNAVLMAKDFPNTEPQRVTLAAGETSTVAFVLDGTTSGVTIRVQDAESNPIPRASVTVLQSKGNASRQTMIYGGAMGTQGGLTTGPDGTVATYNISGEPCSVSVNAAGYAPANIPNAQDLVSGGELLITLESEGAFLVTVYDANGEALDGIQVTARKGSGGGGASQIRTMGGGFGWGGGNQTSGGGFVRIGGLSAGDYTIQFSEQGEQLGSLTSSLGVGEEVPLEFSVQPGIVVQGMVRVNDEPASGGNLMFQMGRSNKQVTVSTSGSYEVELAAGGKYSVHYQPKGNRLKGGTHEINDSTTLDFDFESVTFSGTILDADGNALANTQGWLQGDGWYSFRTDSNGQFTIDTVSPGTYKWNVTAPEGMFAPSREVTIDGMSTGTYQLEAGRTLRIVFGGTPPERAWVNHVAEDGTRTFLQAKGSPQSDDGITVSWPVDAKRGFVFGGNSARAYFEVPEGSDTVEVVMEAGGTLTVTVQDSEGNALGNHAVRVEPEGDSDIPEDLHNEKTQANGLVWLRVSPGTYKISTTLPSGEKIEKTASVTENSTEAMVLGGLNEEG